MPPRRKPVLPQGRAAPTFACTVLRTARAGQTKITAVGHMCGEITTFVPTPHLTEIEKHSARPPDGRVCAPICIENMTTALSSASMPVKLEAPMCINVVRLQDYLLAPDEVVLFDWLLVKQAYVFNYKPFYYSQRRIEKETRIGRRRFETILRTFKDQGWLWSEVMHKGPEQGQVRHYAVDYRRLSEHLDQIVRYGSATYEIYKTYLAQVAPLAAAVQQKNDGAAYRDVAAAVQSIEDGMQRLYRRTVEEYNAGLLTGEVPERLRSYAQLPVCHAHRMLLQRLMQTYDSPSLLCAFKAYCHQVMLGEYEPQSIVGYFLTCNQVTGDFPVVADCLNAYNLYYTRPR